MGLAKALEDASGLSSMSCQYYYIARAVARPALAEDGLQHSTARDLRYPDPETQECHLCAERVHSIDLVELWAG